jgi:hypothetical protein
MGIIMKFISNSQQLVFIVLTAIIVQFSLLAQVAHARQAQKEEASAKILANEAIVLSQKREVLAVRLMAILEDEQKPATDRVRAARALGQMEYVQALPLLLRSIDLMEKEGAEVPVPGVGATVLDQYPCVETVASFGAQSVPHILAELLRTPGKDSRHYLLMRVTCQASIHNELAQAILSVSRTNLTRQQRLDLATFLKFLEEQR